MYCSLTSEIMLKSHISHQKKNPVVILFSLSPQISHTRVCLESFLQAVSLWLFVPHWSLTDSFPTSLNQQAETS